MTVRVYRHDDASAPTLSGLAGGVLGVIRACLVDGYGAKAGAGWSESFSATNKAVFRQGGGNLMYLRVDDSTTQTARVRGYETMSDIDTGTGPFPTDAQMSGGDYLYKSSTTDSTARAWALIATATAFYLYIGFSDATISAPAQTGARHLHFFGDIVSYKTGDAYHTVLCAHSSSSQTSTNFAQVNTINASAGGHYAARSYTQIGAAVALGKMSDLRISGGTMGGSGVSYPDPVTGGMLLAPVMVHESVSGLTRGVMPGLWAPVHNMPGQSGDTFSGSGALAGKAFILLNSANSSTPGRFAIEISDTW